MKKVRPRVKIAATKNHSFFGKPNTHQQRVNSIHTRLTRLQRLTCNGDYLKLNWPGILAHMPLPSAKSKPQEQKDPKKQKSLLGWLSKPADTKVANSSSAVRNAPVTSSSPSGRESIFETPSTKKRTTFGADAPTVRSATFSKSSDGGTSLMKRLQAAIRSMWTCPPMKMCLAAALNLCVVPVHMHLLGSVTMNCVTGSHKTENYYR